tara:strand:+ start:407 stop:790 length:384 start_codon:yes stop_codon:yes gene_type:complete
MEWSFDYPNALTVNNGDKAEWRAKYVGFFGNVANYFMDRTIDLVFQDGTAFLMTRQNFDGLCLTKENVRSFHLFQVDSDGFIDFMFVSYNSYTESIMDTPAWCKVNSAGVVAPSLIAIALAAFAANY